MYARVRLEVWLRHQAGRNVWLYDIEDLTAGGYRPGRLLESLQAAGEDMLLLSDYDITSDGQLLCIVETSGNADATAWRRIVVRGEPLPFVDAVTASVQDATEQLRQLAIELKALLEQIERTLDRKR